MRCQHEIKYEIKYVKFKNAENIQGVLNRRGLHQLVWPPYDKIMSILKYLDILKNHLSLYFPLCLIPEHSRTLPEDWSQSLWQKNNTTRAPLNCAKSSRTLSRRWKSAKNQQQQEIITKSLQVHVLLTKLDTVHINRDPYCFFLQVISRASMPNDILAQAKFYLPIHIPCDTLWDG